MVPGLSPTALNQILGASAATTGAASGGLLAALGGPWGIGASLLPLLFSLFGKDPAKANREELMRLLSPEYLAEQQQKVLRLSTALPENIAARSNIVASGSQLTNALAQSLGQRGLGTSGIASVALPISQSATAGRLGQFSGALSAGALARAQELVRAQVEAFSKHPYGQSRVQGGLDRSMSALLPALGEYFKRRYPAPKIA